LHRRTLTLHRGSLTLHRRTLSLHRRSLTLHRRTLTLHRRTLSLHRRTLTLRGRPLASLNAVCVSRHWSHGAQGHLIIAALCSHSLRHRSCRRARTGSRSLILNAMMRLPCILI